MKGTVVKAVFSLHFHFKATECSEEITESFFSTVNHLGVNSLSFTSDNLFYWDSAQVVSESLKNPNVSFIQETLNFQGSFAKIYRNFTAKFKDKKPVSTCSKLEIPENTAR